MNQLARFLPFLRWFPLRANNVKLDFLSGITVALILVPQSMAYAQLAGLPAYYGLYAAFLPGIMLRCGVLQLSWPPARWPSFLC